MSAAIIPLPGAAAAPVTQTRRNGRHPKMVVSLRRFKLERYDAQNSAQAREKEVARLREFAARSQDLANWQLFRAAKLEAEALSAHGTQGGQS